MQAPRHLRFPVSVLLTFFTGLTISLFALWFTAYQEDMKIYARFQRDVDERVFSLSHELKLAFSTLYGIRGLFNASSHVDRREFHIFVTPSLENQVGIQALEWVPRVPIRHRQTLESQTRLEGYASFRISERKSQGDMIRAADREVYFPVLYLEPMAPNRTSLGFDLASSPKRLATLRQSRDSGRLLATAPVTLVQETGRQKGVLVFLPIYHGSPETVEERRENLRGFAVGVFRIGDIFNTALQRIHDHGDDGIGLTVLDESGPLEERLLHRHEVRGERGDHTYTKSLPDIGGRRWSVIAHPTTAYLTNHHPWMPLVVFLGSLMITLLLARVFHINATRTAEVRRLIDERTRDLRERERENRAIIDTAVQALIKINGRGIVETFNPAAERMFGYERREIIGQNVKMLMPEPFHSAHDGYLDNYHRTGQQKIIGIGREVQGRRKGGSTFPLYLAVGEMEIRGEKKFVGFLLDITRQKEADRLKNEFVSTVSHELRTPLTSIKGSLGLVLGGGTGRSPPQVRGPAEKSPEQYRPADPVDQRSARYRKNPVRPHGFPD